LDDCPKPDPDISPIPLLYSGFGHFLDIMDGCENVPGLADIEVPKLQKAVDEFARKVTEFIDAEEWASMGLHYLMCIFTARRGPPIPRIQAGNIGSIGSDGHNITANGTSSIVVKFKNTLIRNTALPQIELVGYVAHLNTTTVNVDEARQLYLQWKAPCLGLTIVGELDTFIFQLNLT